MLVGKRDYLSRLQTLLVFLILNGTAKEKLAMLAFLQCKDIVKNSIVAEQAFTSHKNNVFTPPLHTNCLQAQYQRLCFSQIRDDNTELTERCS